MHAVAVGAALISCEWFWQAGESRMEDILARERAVADMFGWTHLEGKHKDDGWDMVTPDGSRVTIRFDVMSEETGMHFLELEQRADRGSRWKASIRRARGAAVGAVPLIVGLAPETSAA